MSAPESRYEPRHEAEVVAWNDLTEDQRAGVEGAHGLFSQMAKVADGVKKHASSGLAELDIFLPHIDEQRRNHVVLIDGERGTGKTAVMLRLLVDWSAAVRGELRGDIESKEHGPSPVTLESAIVPVGLLDLQALSPKAMLGLHLAGHLQRVVEAMERRTSKSTKTAPWAPGESEELNSRKAWRKFLSAAAAAWDGNLKERQGKIDPEAYIIELEHAERERLEIGGTFREFVNALVEDYHQQFHPKKKPFFVITIDDADMNPQRTMEIFELIRVLWHPRVGFLIAGDGELFKTVLEQHFKFAIDVPELVTKLRGFGNGPVGAYFEHAEDAKKLAQDAHTKAIPRTQRFRTGLNAADRFLQMSAALGTLKSAASFPNHKLDVRDYFLIDERLQEAFSPRIRDLIELKNEIGQTSPSVASVAWKVWLTALGRIELPRGLLDKEIIQWVGPTNDNKHDDKLKFSRDVQWVPQYTEAMTLKISDNVRALVNKEVRFVSPDGDLHLPDALIPAYQSAANIAIHENVLANGFFVFVVRDVELVHLDFLEKGIPSATTAWIAPLWESFLDHALFLQAWRRTVDAYSAHAPEDRSLDLLARRFIELCLDYAEPSLTRINGRLEVILASATPTWASLASRVVELIQVDRHAAYRPNAVRMWAVRQASVMAAPEYGLSSTAANEWLDALRDAFGTEWDKRRERLKEARAARFGGNAANGTMIDNAFTAHKWAEAVEARPVVIDNRAYKNAVDVITGLLNNTPKGGSVTPGISPPKVGEYISFNRKQILERANLADLQRMQEKAQDMPQGKRDTAQGNLKKLWDAATPEGSLVNTFILWDSNTRGISLKPDLAFEIRNQSESEKNSIAIVKEKLSSGTSFCLRPMVADWTSESRKLLTPATDFLLRIAWDTLVDAHDTTQNRIQMTSITTIWRGAAFWNATSPTEHYCWPVPDWPAPIDWENLVEYWNRQIVEASSLLMPGDAKVTQSVVDAVAFSFLESLSSSKHPKATSVEFTDAKQWSDLGKRLPFRSLINKDGTTTTSALAEAYNDWWHRVVVMAAPEMGLSTESAGAFLDGLFNTEAQKTGEFRNKSDAPRRRRQHAIDCGIDPEQVDAILAQIDSEHPDHPWHKFFAKETT